MKNFKPAYLQARQSGKLARKIEKAKQMLESCALCPRSCGVDRTQGETGACGVGRRAIISSFSPHFGEEAPLVGEKGSGTVFFGGCNLGCLFCQNWEISHGLEGQKAQPDEVAGVMLSLQNQGCHNINLVTPTHVTTQILEGLDIAADHGLSLPIVYNCGGYESLETLALLDGLVDIYMPDFKFWDPQVARAACDAPDYPQRAREALVEMHRQVGELTMDEQGRAQRGLLVRHLVLPNQMAGSMEIFEFIAKKLSPRTYVNVMSQYRPVGRAAQVPGLERGLSEEEFQAALREAEKAGLTRLDQRSRTFVFQWEK